MRIRSLLNHSAVYAVSNLLQRGLTFLLLPIYTRYLSKGEFGAMDLLYQSVFVLGLLTSLGMTQGLSRGIHLDSDTEQERRRLLGVLVSVLLPLAFLFSGLLFAFSEPLSGVLFQGKGDGGWLRYTSFFYLVVTLQQLPLQYLRTTGRAKQFAITNLASFVVIAGLNILLVVYYGLGLRGMLLANIVGFGAATVFLFPGFLKNVELNLDLSRLKPLLIFGAAMLPALLGRKILEVSDRYVLPHFHSLDALGSYVMAAKVAGLLDVLVLVPFLYAWQPFFYSHAKNPEAPRVFARVTHYMLMLLSCVVLGMEVASGYIVHFLGGGHYADARSGVMLLVFAVALNGLQYTISPGIHLGRRLGTEAFFMLGAAVLNLLLNLLLIPKYAGNGAAFATAVSYGAYFVGTACLSQSLLKVPYLWKRMSLILAAAVAGYLALRAFDGLLPRLAVLAAYAIIGPGRDLLVNGELSRSALKFFRRKPELTTPALDQESLG